MNILGIKDKDFVDTIERAIDVVRSKYPDFPINDTVFDISTRLKTTAGRAFIWQNRIELNYRLLKVNKDHLYQTVIHEIAHLIMPQAGHGENWIYAMERLGVEPRRCHKMDVSVVVERIKYKCYCQEHNVTKQMHKKIQNGALRRCKRCKHVLVAA